MIGLLPTLAQTTQPITGLTIGGVVIMTISVGLVLSLSAFCLYRILRAPQPAQHHHAPLETDTHDRDT